MAKIVVFYYTQTGQTLAIAQSVCKPLEAAGNQVIYKEIVPCVHFPYPWGADSFFQAFPESREAIPCNIEAFDFSDIEEADLVIIAYQAWFLSPSIPVHAFFQDAAVKAYLKGKKVIAIDGCRNMWVMAHQKVKAYLHEAGAEFVGNIILQDKTANLVSVITIIRWLVMGKKEKTSWLPPAGVSEQDIENASVFGEVIENAVQKADFGNLQEALMTKGAIHYHPNLVLVEKAGHRIFGLWATFVLKKGAYGSKDRRGRLWLFKYYLMTLLYLISPVGIVLFYLAYPFRLHAIERDKYRQCYQLK